MSLKYNIQTTNSNIHLKGCPNGTYLLNVMNRFNGQPAYVVVKRFAWLECHDKSANTHKYYNIIETAGGKIIAFWGRIFKDGGFQIPKFGEVKNSSYSDLVITKTRKRDYQIMYFWQDDNNEIAYNSSEINVKLIGIGEEESTPPTVHIPMPPSPIIPVPIEAQLDDKKQQLLIKLKNLQSLAIDTRSNIASLGIASIKDTFKEIWNAQDALYWSDCLSQILKDINYIIEKLTTKAEIDKETLVDCNNYYNTITKASKICEVIIKIKGK